MINKPDERDQNYVHLLTGRLHGTAETDIASARGFGSPQALYQRLHHDGFPVCPVCGKTHVAPGHCTPKRRRQPRRGGEATRLPPAVEGAERLFPDAYNKLADDVANLRGMEEHLHGERFVAAHVPPRDAPPFYYRSMFPDNLEGKEEWEEVCRRYGMDPHQTTEFYPPKVHDSAPLGATQVPPEALVRVIGVYALLGIPLDILLDAFHPDPASVDAKNRERMELAAQGLRHEAGQFSKLARGGTIRRGPSTEELSPEELEAAYWTRRLQNDGVPVKDIHKVLKKHKVTGFSQEKLSELRKLQIQPPS